MNEVRDYKTAKTAPEVREGPNGAKMITGYGVVFNSDSENLGGFIEQVDPASVTKTLAEADIRAIANHNTDWLLGRKKSGTARFVADNIGVRYEIDVNSNDPDGQRALAKVERGDWDGSSFCFETLQESWDWEATPARRRLLEIKLVEMGPVTFPAYPDSTAAARALTRVAKKLGHPVERMAEALKTGAIRSLVDNSEREGRAAVGSSQTVAWDPENGFNDLLADIDEQLNPGWTWRYCPLDVRLDASSVLIYDFESGEDESGYWVAPLSLDADNEPVVAPLDEWTSVAQVWVVAPDSLRSLHRARREARALTTGDLTGEKPEPETPEPDVSMDGFRALLTLRQRNAARLAA